MPATLPRAPLSVVAEKSALPDCLWRRSGTILDAFRPLGFRVEPAQP